MVNYELLINDEVIIAALYYTEIVLCNPPIHHMTTIHLCSLMLI